MKTFETVFATDKFVTLVLVILDDAVKLRNQLRQSGGALVSRLDVGFNLCLGALLSRNALAQGIELFAQIFRGAVVAARIVASTTGVVGIWNQSLTGSAWHADALRISTATPYLAITILVRRFALARYFGPLQVTVG